MDHNDAPLVPLEAVTPDAPSPTHWEPDDVAPSWQRWLLIATIAATFGIDQLTKAVAVEALATGPAHIGIFHLRLVANRGILMGMLPSPLIAVAVATLLVVWVAVRAGRRNGARMSIAFGFLAGGALGNFVDRILQRPQFPDNAVVDWLSFGGMTFNLADVALLLGALILLTAPQSAREKTDT